MMMMPRRSLTLAAIVGLVTAAFAVVSKQSLGAQTPPGGPSVTVANTSQHPVPVDPSGFTHIGQPAGEHVTLLMQHSAPFGFARINPDLSLDQNEFTIPAGKVFVLMDVFWEGLTAENVHATVVLGRSVGTGNLIPVVISSGLSDRTGRVNGSEHLTSGVVLSTMPRVTLIDFFVSDGLRLLVIEGYLAPAV
jgi:hypothetical protein